MYNFSFLIALLLRLLHLNITSSVCPDNPGNQRNTLFLKEIFIGRCLQYQITSLYSSCSSPQIDCKELFELFIAPFDKTEECSEKVDLYQKFFDKVREDIPKDKALFWSRTSILSHEIGQNTAKYITLEDTLPGYLANNLSWCGKPKATELNTNKCLRTCPNRRASANYEFWIQASINFAKSVSGVVTVLLNGSLDSQAGVFAFNDKSIFAKYELPNFSKSKVTKVHAILVHTLDKPKSETCLSPSMMKLKAQVTERGFAYQCIDDPPIVKLLLCSQNPNAVDCKSIVTM